MIAPLVVVGNGRAGKDTFGAIVSKNLPIYNYVGASSNFLVEEYANEYNLDAKEVFENRHTIRKKLFDYANEKRKDDPGYLIKRILNKSILIIGIRDISEIEYCHEKDYLIVWIENNRVPTDETVIFKRSDCDVIIDNNGSVEEFELKIKKFCKYLT